MGICPCIKHIPGHFSSPKDPHLEVLESNLNKDDIDKQIEYLEFIANYPLAMTSHIKLNNIDDKNPTTVSKKVITNIIREKLQFDGFLLSDAIDMKALSENIVKKHNNALDAGVDATCYCSGNIEELERICNEKRFMTEKSLNRFENIKKVIHNPCEKIDVEAQRSLYNHGLNKWFDEIYLYDATEVLHHMQKKGENL